MDGWDFRRQANGHVLTRHVAGRLVETYFRPFANFRKSTAELDREAVAWATRIVSGQGDR